MNERALRTKLENDGHDDFYIENVIDGLADAKHQDEIDRALTKPTGTYAWGATVAGAYKPAARGNTATDLNEKRADRARETLEFYKLTLKESGPACINTLTDLLTDLLHWRRAHAEEDMDETLTGYDEDVRNARDNFRMEVNEETT